MWNSVAFFICIVSLNGLQCCGTLFERINTFGDNIETYPKVYFRIENPIDGSYYFSYDTGTHYQSFREERRDSLGEVKGMFGYVEPEGVLRITSYIANRYGYRATTTTRHLVRNDEYSIIGLLPFPATHRRKNIPFQANPTYFFQKYIFDK